MRECVQEAAHVFAVLSADVPDTVIWRIALDSGDGVVTKDEDCGEWLRLRQPARSVPREGIGKLKKVELRGKVVPLLPELVKRLQAGQALIEKF